VVGLYAAFLLFLKVYISLIFNLLLAYIDTAAAAGDCSMRECVQLKHVICGADQVPESTSWWRPLSSLCRIQTGSRSDTQIHRHLGRRTCVHDVVPGTDTQCALRTNDRRLHHDKNPSHPFLARDSIMQSALYAIARPSVRPAVTRVDQSKTVEVRIVQLWPQSSPIPLVFLAV